MTTCKVKVFIPSLCNILRKANLQYLCSVDDIIILGDDELEKQILKEKLVTQLEIKDFLMLEYLLRIKVAYSLQLILLFVNVFCVQTNTQVSVGLTPFSTASI